MYWAVELLLDFQEVFCFVELVDLDVGLIRGYEDGLISTKLV